MTVVLLTLTLIPTCSARWDIKQCLFFCFGLTHENITPTHHSGSHWQRQALRASTAVLLTLATASVENAMEQRHVCQTSWNVYLLSSPIDPTVTESMPIRTPPRKKQYRRVPVPFSQVAQ